VIQSQQQLDFDFRSSSHSMVNTNMFSQNHRRIKIRSQAQRSAVVSLATFFGPAKKVTRLPAGTGEVGS